MISNNNIVIDFLRRDAKDTSLLVGAKSVEINNILITLGLALQEGLQKALETSFKVQVKSDSIVLINYSNCSIYWRIKKIVENIK
jgi:hypothetical protein